MKGALVSVEGAQAHATMNNESVGEKTVKTIKIKTLNLYYYCGCNHKLHLSVIFRKLHSGFGCSHRQVNTAGE